MKVLTYRESNVIFRSKADSNFKTWLEITFSSFPHVWGKLSKFSFHDKKRWRKALLGVHFFFFLWKIQLFSPFPNAKSNLWCNATFVWKILVRLKMFAEILTLRFWAIDIFFKVLSLWERSCFAFSLASLHLVLFFFF